MGKPAKAVKGNGTKLKRSEVKLPEAEAVYSTMVEQVRDGIYIAQDEAVKFVNGALTEITGYSKEELESMHFLDIVMPEYGERTAQRYKSRIEGDSLPPFFELKIRCKDETIKDIEATGTVIQYNGKPAIMGVIRDITERKQMEEFLRQQEEYFRSLIENSLDAITVLNEDGTLRYASPSFERILGRSLGDGTEYNVLEYVYEKDMQMAADSFARLIQNPGSIMNEEVRVWHKDGSLRNIEVIGQNLLDNPAVAGIISNFRDITKRKQIEEELSQAKEFKDKLIASMHDGLSVVDIEGNRIEVNPALCEMTGFSREELLSQYPGPYWPPEGYEEIITKLFKAYTGEIGEFETILMRKNGERFPVIVSGSSMKDEQGNAAFFAATIKDISMRKQMEEQLKIKDWAMDSSINAICMADLDGKLIYVNASFLKMWDYTGSEEVAEVNAVDLWREQKEASRIIKMLRKKGIWQGELIGKRRNGSTFDAYAQASMVKDDNGNPICMMVSFVDTTKAKQAEEEIKLYQQNLEKLVDERTGKLAEANDELTIRIAELRQAERALRESERKYKDLADLLPQIVFETDKKGRFTFVNRKGYKSFGYTKEDFAKGLNAFQTLVPEDRARARDNMRRVLSGEKVEGNEYFALRKDGSTFPILIFSSPIIRENKPIGLRGIVMDITERKRMEEALARSEKRFRALCENSLDVIAIIDRNGIIQYVGSSLERVLGYTPEERIGGSHLDLVHPDDHERMWNLLAELLQSPGATVRTEGRYRHKDGSWLYIAGSGKNLLDDPAVEGIVLNFQDITGRKRFEEALIEREEYFRSLIENSTEVIAVLNRDGTIRYESPSMEKVTGYGLEEREGRSIFEYVHPDDLPHLNQELEQMLKNPGATVHLELRGLWKDGKWHHIEASGKNLLDDPVVEGIVINFRDATERKSADQELLKHYEEEKNLRQQLEAEMKRRVEFTRALAHELKTPLTSVLASSDLLASELTDEPVLSLAKNVRQGAHNLNRRIDELLDLARGEVGMLQLKKEPIDLLQLLRDTADTMTALASGRGQSIVLALPPSIPVIEADGDRLQQVVTNLLNNATKFTPKGGKITLRAKKKGSLLIVEVQDTGRGISKEEQERLFEPYQRLENDRENFSGLGLGLTLCKTLVELHGGNIWLRSRIGKGSTFGFSLPLSAPLLEKPEPEKETKLWKVLIIEDDQEIVNSVSLTFKLRWPEAELISTGLGEEGVELVETDNPDIVILDLGLPDVSGFDVLRQIRLFSSVPIIILTVKDDEADMVKGLEWGADDYVVKPFRQLELLARLKVQLRKQVPPDEEAAIVCGSLRLDPATFQLICGGKEISLTIVEGRIIEHLMRNAGHVVTHSRLAEAVWGEDYPGAIDSLRVYIRYLRQKLETDPSHPRLIVTKSGIGYSLVKPG